MLRHKNIIVVCLILLVLFCMLKTGWWVFLLLFIGFTVLVSWGSFDIRQNYFLKAYSSNPDMKERKIALTFDDGPHQMTGKVLDLLQQYNAKATFFCIGTQIEKYPDIMQRIVREGHVVGNHTYSHSKSFGFFPSAKVKEEISRNDELLFEFTRKKIKFFRPPFGVTNPNVAKAIAATKHTVIGWNVRSLDTVIQNEDAILKRIKNKAKPGSVVLLHDTSLKTVRVLEQLLLFLQSEKYDMVAIDKLLNLPAYED